VGFPSTWALGYSTARFGGVESRAGSTFGMGGSNGSAAYADIDSGVAVAVMRNRIVGDMSAAAAIDQMVATIWANALASPVSDPLTGHAPRPLSDGCGRPSRLPAGSRSGRTASASADDRPAIASASKQQSYGARNGSDCPAGPVVPCVLRADRCCASQWPPPATFIVAGRRLCGARYKVSAKEA
jgi:hypothetical protein